MKIGHYLKSKREKLKITQSQIAKALGYTSAQLVSNVERGVCSPPLSCLGKWCDLVKANKKRVMNIMLKEHKNKLSKALGVK